MKVKYKLVHLGSKKSMTRVQDERAGGQHCAHRDLAGRRRRFYSCRGKRTVSRWLGILGMASGLKSHVVKGTLTNQKMASRG